MKQSNNHIDERVAAAPTCLVELPASWTDFFAVRGPIRCEFNDRRAYRRVHWRGEAMLELGDEQYRVYTKDVSRGGLSFLHHKQLFPLDRVTLWISADVPAELEVVCCTRIGQRCYVCGARTVDEIDRDALLSIVRTVVVNAPA